MHRTGSEAEELELTWFVGRCSKIACLFVNAGTGTGALYLKIQLKPSFKATANSD